MNTVAIIPARGGSKGIPRKNVRTVAGKPLIAWTIEDALESRQIHGVFVSTDDDEIARESERAGATVIRRPSEIAADMTPSEPALLHALDTIETGHGPVAEVVFLQATAPMRTGADIDAALGIFRTQGVDSLLSVCAMRVFLWTDEGGTARPTNYDFHARPMRQVMQPLYRENGSIYIFRPALLRSTGFRLGGKVALFKMEEEANLDIDNEIDLDVAGLYLARKEPKTS